VPTTFGTTVITTTATTLGGATAYDQRRVASSVIPGTTVLDVTDPAGDDNGPGTFRYPTSADFHAGAFDLRRFEVVDGGDTVYLRTTLGDLEPTFGDPLGAQLLTVFVHDPAQPQPRRLRSSPAATTASPPPTPGAARCRSAASRRRATSPRAATPPGR
jgi:glucoamylase